MTKSLVSWFHFRVEEEFNQNWVSFRHKPTTGKDLGKDIKSFFVSFFAILKLKSNWVWKFMMTWGNIWWLSIEGNLYRIFQFLILSYFLCAHKPSNLQISHKIFQILYEDIFFNVDIFGDLFWKLSTQTTSTLWKF